MISPPEFTRRGSRRIDDSVEHTFSRGFFKDLRERADASFQNEGIAQNTIFKRGDRDKRDDDSTPKDGGVKRSTFSEKFSRLDEFVLLAFEFFHPKNEKKP